MVGHFCDGFRFLGWSEIPEEKRSQRDVVLIGILIAYFGNDMGIKLTPRPDSTLKLKSH